MGTLGLGCSWKVEGRLQKDMSLQEYAPDPGTKQASSQSPVPTLPRTVFKGHRATTPMPPWLPASSCSYCSLNVDLQVLREAVLRGPQVLPELSTVVAEFRGMPHGQANATKHTSSFKFFSCPLKILNAELNS